MTTKINETTNYENFDLIEFNRNVKKTKELERSMTKYGWIPAYPMHVTVGEEGRLKIVAGQHRFAVARSLGLPVKYVVVDNSCDVTIHELELSTRAWSVEDYLISFVRTGKKDYILVEDYVKRTGISASQVASMLAGELATSNNGYKRFKQGTYKVKTTEHIEKVYTVVLQLENAGITWARNRMVVGAISRICFVDNFNMQRMLQKIKQFPQQIQKKPNVKEYTAMLEHVYNFASKDKQPLAFMSDQAAKERNFYLRKKN